MRSLWLFLFLGWAGLALGQDVVQRWEEACHLAQAGEYEKSLGQLADLRDETPSWDAARLLLIQSYRAKVLLHSKDYQTCLNLCEDLLSPGRFVIPLRTEVELHLCRYKSLLALGQEPRAAQVAIALVHRHLPSMPTYIQLAKEGDRDYLRAACGILEALKQVKGLNAAQQKMQKELEAIPRAPDIRKVI